MTPEELAVAMIESEAFMWLMAGANHPEMWLDLLRVDYKEYQRLGGSTWGR